MQLKWHGAQVSSSFSPFWAPKSQNMRYRYFKGYLIFLGFDPYFLTKYTFHGTEVMFFYKALSKCTFDKSLGDSLLKFGDKNAYL